MAYCRDCGNEMSDSRDTYCNSCEQNIVSRARSSVNRAEYDERQRMRNDQDYAHSWLQSAIGWISALWGILQKVFTGCYITTAFVGFKGYNDNCEEMMLFRELRKYYLSRHPIRNSQYDRDEYHIIGDGLIRWINSRIDNKEIWEYISLYIEEVIFLIKQDNFDVAYEYFRTRTLTIKHDVYADRHKTIIIN